MSLEADTSLSRSPQLAITNKLQYLDHLPLHATVVHLASCLQVSLQVSINQLHQLEASHSVFKTVYGLCPDWRLLGLDLVAYVLDGTRLLWNTIQIRILSLVLLYKLLFLVIQAHLRVLGLFLVLIRLALIWLVQISSILSRISSIFWWLQLIFLGGFFTYFLDLEYWSVVGWQVAVGLGVLWAAAVWAWVWQRWGDWADSIVGLAGVHLWLLLHFLDGSIADPSNDVVGAMELAGGLVVADDVLRGGVPYPKQPMSLENR